MAAGQENETIGNWTKGRLVRFIQGILSTDPSALPPAIDADELAARTKLTVSGDIELSPQALKYIKDNLPP
jgi:hypothetical protein